MFSGIFNFGKVICYEIYENTIMIKEIVNYHNLKIREFSEKENKKVELIKKLKQCRDLRQWKEYALEFDNLKGNIYI